ncbi:type 4 pilus major pilin [Apirhabdus apintestini]|uniref:type 4 pilus major pilin n=1 Tax=Erwinia sp. HR93 TaxID=3094840 RepID=UPI002ADEF66E|nr:type 4 pilus major pilin [Erwinia sp. HR93]MEA1063813.1 type 4 pilus major pilin [Erwinia sp. HR93]WPM83974.1 type 4 pilus major pilin [Enterobacteriaceae bacterium CA-0114]
MILSKDSIQYQSHLLKKERGFTALELIIVLIVGFSIIALSASKMGQLFSSSSTNDAMNSILGLYSSTRALQNVNGYGNDGDDLTKVLIDTDTIPKSLAINKSDGSAKNEWAGTVTVSVTNSGNGFVIDYPNVPKESCIKLAQQLIHSGNFSSISVAGTDLDNDKSLKDVSDACGSDKNAMKFNVNANS